MASGHVNRTNRPNTWLHRPACGREESPCQPGAVHTWHVSAVHRCPLYDRFSNRPSGSSAFRLSSTPVSMSLTGSRFSSDSAPRPFHHGIRRRGGTNLSSDVAGNVTAVQADVRTHLIHRPARDIIPPLGGARVSSYCI